jgi:hypothetical protein
MVEFPFGWPGGTQGVAAPVRKIYPKYRDLLTLILRHQTRG